MYSVQYVHLYIRHYMPNEWLVVSVLLIPRQANQKLKLARQATSAATEIQPQQDWTQF